MPVEVQQRVHFYRSCHRKPRETSHKSVIIHFLIIIIRAVHKRQHRQVTVHRTHAVVEHPQRKYRTYPFAQTRDGVKRNRNFPTSAKYARQPLICTYKRKQNLRVSHLLHIHRIVAATPNPLIHQVPSVQLCVIVLFRLENPSTFPRTRSNRFP